MTGATGIISPHTARRAETIYLQARGGIDSRLWRAALGSDDRSNGTVAGQSHPGLALETLLTAAITPPSPAIGQHGRSAAPVAPTAQAAVVAPAESTPADGRSARGGPLPLGYRQYISNIKAAAERTGIPAAALAAIVDAETGKDRAGRWRTDSHNTRSTATGLGQFLAGTWRSEAERVGTWLNDAARARGWLDHGGKVLPQAKAMLLDLRQDADASINATADYARRSLDTLNKAGVAVGSSIEQIAEAAYIGHNLGPGDAIRFFRGTIDDRRARVLLDAQVGNSKAGTRIANAGSAVAAHKTWLLEFVAKQVRSDRFTD